MKDVPLCGKHEFGSIDDRQVMVVCLYICLLACIVVELVFSAAPSTCACFFLMRWVLNCIGCFKKNACFCYPIFPFVFLMLDVYVRLLRFTVSHELLNCILLLPHISICLSSARFY